MSHAERKRQAKKRKVGQGGLNDGPRKRGPAASGGFGGSGLLGDAEPGTTFWADLLDMPLNEEALFALLEDEQSKVGDLFFIFCEMTARVWCSYM